MAELRPFRPLRYNPAAVADLSAVVAPPYDVISSARREALYARSDYNAVRLILSRDADPYGAAAALLGTWRRNRVLVRETLPALCYHVENFILADGSARERQGVIGVVRLEPFHTGRIRPHERTFARAKEDRMRLLRACRTNLSPIFGLVGARPGFLDPARADARARPPDLALRDDAGVEHRLWLITNSDAIAAITQPIADETVLIADGHHRYETALAYADECRARGATDPGAPHNFVLMYLTSMHDSGLVILPTHRVLSGVPGFNGSDLITKLRRYFRIASYPRTARQEFSAGLRQASDRSHVGIALGDSDELLIATVDDPSALEGYAAGLTPTVRHLDVALLDTVILRGLMAVDCTAAAHDGHLTYTHDDDEALDAVERGAQAAFLMNPPRIDDVQAVCLAGETMPEKSTYFHPKLPTGLVFNLLEVDDANSRAARAAAAS